MGEKGEGNMKVDLPEIPAASGNLVMLEHVNITVGERWEDDMTRFWYKVMGAARDTRTQEILDRMYGGTDEAGTRDLRWANFGFQQFHLPTQPAGCYEGLPGLETWQLKQKIGLGMRCVEYWVKEARAL